jgi:NAD(P)-dependent dehydrogenase (short-subunit alcohol dehydrogenase family)
MLPNLSIRVSRCLQAVEWRVVVGVGSMEVVDEGGRVTLLEGKVAIVTGAGSGVGRGVAIALARAGARVVTSSRTLSKCEAVVEEIEAAGGETIAVRCDVRLPKDVEECVARALAVYGGIDILVNAADDPRVDVPFLELTDEIMNASWLTGVMGTVRCMQACVPHMVARGEGAVVNVASGAGLLAPIGMAAYSAAQEAIRSLTRTAATELGPQGIRVNVVCPVASGSESLDRWVVRDPERLAAYVANTPLRRVGDPVDDVGEGVVFLCGPQSRYVTGTTLMLDGGRSYLR